MSQRRMSLSLKKMSSKNLFKVPKEEGYYPHSYEVVDYEPKSGEGKPRRAVFVGKGEMINAQYKNLFESFKNGVSVSGKRNCFGRRKIVDGVAGDFEWKTYDEVFEMVKHIGAAFIHLGAERNANIGIYSINRPEWMMVDLSCIAYGLVSVPLYDTLGDEAIAHIVNQAELKYIALSADKVNKLLEMQGQISTLNTFIIMDDLSDELRKKMTDANIKAFQWNEFVALGKEHPAEFVEASLDDIATIMYTSGTTGLPKGAMLTHRNFLANVESVNVAGKLGRTIYLSQNDVHISYLPLAHVFERMVVIYMLQVGAAIGFYQGDPLKLLDDMSVLRPTFFASVPRLLNRVHAKFLSTIDKKGGVSATLFHKALKAKKANLRHGTVNHWFWDKIIFNKVKARLGGRVRGIVTGSAPISPEVLDFFRTAFCCEVHEGYGQTESCAFSSITESGDYEAGTVGTPAGCNEIKLVDVLEMNYSVKDTPYPRGEICFRGANVFKGYYKEPEKTKEAIDEDGWLHSGDIGMWDEKGRLKIIDRKKNIFKLAQGEYIAPEKIENVYGNCKYVAQSFVYGDSLKSFLVGIVVADEECVMDYCTANGISGTFAEVCQNETVITEIFNEMVKCGKTLGLKGFEQVRAIHVTPEPFTVENNILTPTFKLKRPQSRERFSDIIDKLIDKVETADREAGKH